MTESLPGVGVPSRSTEPLPRSYGRTDVRTYAEPRSPSGEISPLVTRTRTYGEMVLGDCLLEATNALEAATTRAGKPRHEPRQEIHTWTRRAIYWRDRNRCAWCLRGFNEAGMLVLDHIQPWSAGGSDRSDNLRTLCVPCNDERSNYATDSYTRVTPVGLCDRCASRGYFNSARRYVWHQLDPEATYLRRIFCGMCGRIGDCTDRKRVL